MNWLFTGVDVSYRGGLERFAVRAADLLRSRGESVDVVLRAPEDLGAYDRVVMHKIPGTVAELRRLKATCGDRLRFFAHDHCLYCLRRHSYRPGHRLCERGYAFFPCRLCAAVTRPSFLWRNLTYPLPDFIREMKTVRTFATSSFVRDRLLGVGLPSALVTTLNPVFLSVDDAPRPVSSWMPEGRLRLLFLGQLVAGKGVALLLEALARLPVPCELSVAGTGPDEAALRAQAATLPPSVRVNFLGWQADPAPLFASADACVVPSLWHEPFGMVGPEALAHGVPAVTFRVGGTGDWLKPGRTGVFADDRTPESLAAAIASLADPQRLAALGASARSFAAESFSVSRFLKEFFA